MLTLIRSLFTATPAPIYYDYNDVVAVLVANGYSYLPTHRSELLGRTTGDCFIHPTLAVVRFNTNNNRWTIGSVDYTPAEVVERFS